MEREISQVRSTEELREETLSGLATLRQHLIEANADMDHRPDDPDPAQRAKCNLSFVLHAVNPLVSEYFYRRWMSLNFGSALQRLNGRSLQYSIEVSEWMPEGKVVIPSYSNTGLNYRTLENLYEKNLYRREIERFGNLSREQILQKFEKAIR